MMLQWQIEEAKMSVSDTAVPVAATWSHPCTPDRRNSVTGTGSSDVGAFGPTPRALLEALNNTSKTIRTSRSRSTALHVRCPSTYHHSHCSRPLVRCREGESAESKDLIKLPSTGSKRRTYATVQTYHTCGCRDNPHQPMAPRRRVLGSFLFAVC